ncbi:conserved hypothetical protein [Candidatus Methylacidithermus pantelleriae]|uniref:WD40 repeat domain-containing protein n=1 Tax=Candidatus Methylacidithermus pantelleriae TaxID=2744239 RepID=A0A8J2BJN7_9BACT|nr:conserved hypothetical protein [Candidatus Methylacidithermus pantelleriae]
MLPPWPFFVRQVPTWLWLVVALLLGTWSPLWCREGDARIFVSTENDGVWIFSYPKFELVGKVALEGRHPRGIALTPDGRYLITANRTTGDLAIINPKTLQVERSLAVGRNPEFVKVHPSGHWIVASYEPSISPAPKGKPQETILPRAHILVWEVGSWKQVADLAAGLETEGIEFSSDGHQLVVTNEGDSTIGVYHFPSGRLIRMVDLKPYGFRPRGIRRSPQASQYAVSLENSSKVLLLNSKTFQVERELSTEAGPYGVAWDPQGKFLIVAAARAGKLQVFDPQTGKLVTSVPVGQRGWHFSFTPDGQAIVVACGRSQDLHVVATGSWKVIQVIPDLPVPWGIVTLPLSAGSLGLP